MENEPKTYSLSLRLKPSTRDKLQAAADRERRSLSWFIADVLDRWEDAAGTTPSATAAAHAPAAPSKDDGMQSGWDVPSLELLEEKAARYIGIIDDPDQEPKAKTDARRELKRTQWLQANPGKTYADAVRTLHRAKR
jgi:uncharacterized protein (DUF1778 family)